MSDAQNTQTVWIQSGFLTLLQALDVLKDSLRKQVEFYFSDANIVNDKWIQKEIKKNPEGCMWWSPNPLANMFRIDVPLTSIASFQKIRKLGGSLQTLREAVVTSAKVQVCSFKAHMHIANIFIVKQWYERHQKNSAFACEI